MDKQKLYDEMAARKSAPKDFNTYIGDNGRVNRCAELIRQGKLKSSGILLDVGGGIGDLGCSVRDLFDKTITLDISEKNLEAARSKGNWSMLSDCDLYGFQMQINPPDGEKTVCQNFIHDESVDLLTALDFIEHIVDPENFARECFRVLKSGGQVFINTPNIEYYPHMKSLVIDGYFPHTSGDKEVYHGGHLSFFGITDMEIIFRNAGFVNCVRVEDEKDYHQPPEFWINLRKPMNQAHYREICWRLGTPNLLFKCEKP